MNNRDVNLIGPLTKRAVNLIFLKHSSYSVNPRGFFLAVLTFGSNRSSHFVRLFLSCQDGLLLGDSSQQQASNCLLFQACIRTNSKRTKAIISLAIGLIYPLLSRCGYTKTIDPILCFILFLSWLSSCYTLQLWHFASSNTYSSDTSSSDTFQLWKFQSWHFLFNTFQSWRFLSDTFQFWHCFFLTLSISDTFRHRSICYFL